MRTHKKLGMDSLERREVLSATAGLEAGLTTSGEELDALPVDLSFDNMVAFAGGDVDSDVPALSGDSKDPCKISSISFPALSGDSKDPCKVSSGNTLELDTTGVDSVFAEIKNNHNGLTHDPEFQDWASAVQGTGRANP